jgi:hypothetical protein
VVLENLQTQGDQDEARRHLDPPPETTGEGCHQTHGHQRGEAGDDPKGRHRQAHRCGSGGQRDTHGEGVDAHGQGQTNEAPAPREVDGGAPVGLPPEPGPDHAAPDEDQEDEGDPVVEGLDVDEERSTDQGPEKRQDGLEQPEVEGNAEDLACRVVAEGEGRAHGERVGGERQGQEQDLREVHVEADGGLYSRPPATAPPQEAGRAGPLSVDGYRGRERRTRQSTPGPRRRGHQSARQGLSGNHLPRPSRGEPRCREAPSRPGGTPPRA